ncbi:PEP-CTERM sorting domain-containing protein [Siccirubricoccus phaeus]|uniref:PEP-CTERM sorting domain-containing protein n=1 Tax=Siccirubricoccus phaeus TaxID=2595053 RepID=UPI00165C8B22|nr:PEP-CTERM sorting domain-containing protein [Siccirubricoccus phaeus]
MVNLRKGCKALLRGVAVAAGMMAASAGLARADVLSLDVGGYNSYLDTETCHSTAGACPALSLSAYGPAGVILTAAPALATGSDLTFILYIMPQGGPPIASLTAILNGSSGVSFGSQIDGGTGSGLAFISGVAGATPASFDPQDLYVQLSPDLNAENGTITSFIITLVPVPAPGALILFGLGLAGLAGLRRGQNAAA